ncbi:reverse transcriptase domain-containing protein [Tanacetum coccineum]
MRHSKRCQKFSHGSGISFPTLTADNAVVEPLTIEINAAGHDIHRMYIDGGASADILYEHCFQRLRPEVKSQLNPATTSLTGFTGEKIWPMGQIRLPVMVGNKEHSTQLTQRQHATKVTNLKVAIHPDYPEQEVSIGGSLSDTGRAAVCALLQRNLDIFAWEPKHMTGVPRSITEHKLKNPGQDTPQAMVAGGCAWTSLTLTSMVHKTVSTTKEIDGISPYADTRDNCYTKMPFGLKNAGATYQRLVDNAFEGQVGRNLEVYVDDLVIKSHTEDELVRDIVETFRALRKINMKLNPKKCTFGATEGMFLGYLIEPDGIKPCPEKTKAVIQLPSPRTMKEVQSLNGKLAGLKTCPIHVSRQVTPPCSKHSRCVREGRLPVGLQRQKKAFTQLKQRYSALTTLVAPGQGRISIALKQTEITNSAMEEADTGVGIAAKRLRRYFPSAPNSGNHLIQPSKQPKNEGGVTKPNCGTTHLQPRMGVRKTRSKWTLIDSPLGKFLEVHNKNAMALSKIASQGFGTIIKAGVGRKKKILKKTNHLGDGDIYGVRREDLTWMTPLSRIYKQGARSSMNKRMPGRNTPRALRFELRNGVLYRRSFPTTMDPSVDLFSRLYAPIVIHAGFIQYALRTMICSSKSLTGLGFDNGKQFCDTRSKMGARLSITQRFASVKHPQTNGLVERANRSLGEGIKARLDRHKGRWVEELSHVLWAHRTTIKVSTGDTPFSLVYGTEAVIPAEIGMPTIRTAEVNIATNDDERRIDLDILEERREQAAIREEKAKLKMKGYYDAKVRGVSFRPGDFVYRANDASHAEDTGKLGPKWEGPYEVTEALGKGAYKLRDMDGRELPRTWNICNLKKCYL